ncbi:MAG: hypothetical protein WKF37_00845 [Bryobacteraceae bacterium]
MQETAGHLEISLPGVKLEKQVDSRGGYRYLSDRRSARWSDWLWRPVEPRLPEGPIDWIDVRYNAATIAWMGIDLHWSLWFLILSSLAALLLKKKMGVSF